MPRRPRVSTGGYVYHVLNRGVARLDIFEDQGDYAAFERETGTQLVILSDIPALSRITNRQSRLVTRYRVRA